MMLLDTSLVFHDNDKDHSDQQPKPETEANFTDFTLLCPLCDI